MPAQAAPAKSEGIPFSEVYYASTLPGVGTITTVLELPEGFLLLADRGNL